MSYQLLIIEAIIEGKEQIYFDKSFSIPCPQHYIKFWKIGQHLNIGHFNYKFKLSSAILMLRFHSSSHRLPLSAWSAICYQLFELKLSPHFPMKNSFPNPLWDFIWHFLVLSNNNFLTAQICFLNKCCCGNSGLIHLLLIREFSLQFYPQLSHNHLCFFFLHPRLNFSRRRI